MNYEYGVKKELEILDILKTKFPKIEHTIEKYSDWDFYDNENKYKIELKSRKINSNKYNSTIIGSNKIYKGKKLLNEGYRIFYIFNYIDKILYFELDNDDKFKQSYFNDKYHSFINKDKLKEFNNIII